MATNNKAIKILRGSRQSIINNKNEILEPGQPLYNTTDNYLTIGSKDKDGKVLNLNQLPIRVRELGGYAEDFTDLSDENPIQEFKIFADDKNTINIQASNYKIGEGLSNSHKFSDILTVESAPQSLIIGRYNKPNWYSGVSGIQNLEEEGGNTNWSNQIINNLIHPILQIGIGSSEDDRQNSLTMYSDGTTYFRKPTYFRNYTEVNEFRAKYNSYFEKPVYFDSTIDVSGESHFKNKFSIYSDPEVTIHSNKHIDLMAPTIYNQGNLLVTGDIIATTGDNAIAITNVKDANGNSVYDNTNSQRLGIYSTNSDSNTYNGITIYCGDTPNGLPKIAGLLNRQIPGKTSTVTETSGTITFTNDGLWNFNTSIEVDEPGAILFKYYDGSEFKTSDISVDDVGNIYIFKDTIYVKITFNTNGGTNVVSQYFEQGGLATRPTTDPTKSGYTFGGWYINQEFTTEFDFNTKISEDITLYAKWDEAIFTTKNGSITGLTDYGKTLTSIVIPEKIDNISITSIGKDAFYNCTQLTSIEIPNSVTSIDNYAFNGCRSLTNIEIPDSITSIGGWAFAGCFSLTSVTIPDNVESIGDYVFSVCKSLETVTIGNGITSISYSAFRECESLINIKISNSVTSIGSSVFYGCTSLKAITIPNSVTSIGDYAFNNCSSLENITFEDISQLTSISYSAFEGCKSLTSIIIPNSVTSIGHSAFKYCSALTSVTIPDSVTSIGHSAFYDCSALQYKTEGDLKYLGNSTNPYLYLADTTATNITSATINSNCKLIGSAFDDCTSLTSVTFESNSRLASIGHSAFNGCTQLTSIEIPNSVTSIGDFAFARCTSLTKIIIPDSITSIGGNAFNGCSSLENATIGDGVTSIETSTFSGCTSLTNITVDENNEVYKSIDGNLYSKDGKTLIQYAIGKTQTSFTIPNSVTTIGDYAFNGCSSLENATIGDGVTSIGQSAFYKCDNLTSVEIPNSVTSISWYAFAFCTSLTNITIPNSVTKIDPDVFCGCSSLQNVTIPNSVTSIGSAAFDDCTSLTSVTFESNSRLASIGHSAFSGCTSLTSVTIPDSVTSIGNGAFRGCSSLQNVTIPNSVTKIDSDAFRDCTLLTSVTLGNSVTSIGNGAFRGCSKLEEITIPFVGAKAGVTSSSTYQYPFGYIFGTSSYTGGVATKQYYYGSSTSSTTYSTYYIPATLKKVTVAGGYIPYGAFYNCESLTSIIIRDSVTNIGGEAFYKCSSLTSIKYNGTKAGWGTIEKNDYWAKNSIISKIICIDGEINL